MRLAHTAERCPQGALFSIESPVNGMRIPYVMQAAYGGLVERDWQGIVHWKTWALAGLDVCISTVKCAGSFNPPAALCGIICLPDAASTAAIEKCTAEVSLI